jgi:hypothetical protein
MVAERAQRALSVIELLNALMRPRLDGRGVIEERHD